MENSKNKLLDIGIKKLKNFGFLNVNHDNITKDEVYKHHFKMFINSLKGENEDLDTSIKELFSLIDKKE